MIKLDPILFEFLKYNTVTCGFIIGFLKGLALLTKSTTDDKIMTLIGNIFSSASSKGGTK